MKFTKKFFILKNLKSDYIEQAIFVLKEATPEPEPCSDVVREAEKIVEKYLENLGYNPAKNKLKEHKKRGGFLINISIVLGVMAIAALISKLC